MEKNNALPLINTITENEKKKPQREKNAQPYPEKKKVNR